MNSIISKAKENIGSITKRELWLIGSALYWVEGSKEKEWKPGSGVQFMNMDKNMVKVFLRWLDLCKITKDKICFDVYLHSDHIHRINEIKAEVTDFPVSSFSRIYIKKNKINTKRKNVSKNYFGTLKVIVRQSSDFLREITGWINGIYNGINIEH